jgi:hypothetical protein
MTEEQAAAASRGEYKPPAVPAPNLFDRIFQFNEHMLDAEREGGIRPGAPKKSGVPSRDRRLCSFKTGAISLYRLRANRTCAERIIPQSYAERFPL